MSTEKQQAANRRNALKSTGPKSADGKQRSALNAYRHGLTAQVAVMPEEERAAFENFATPLIDTLAPANPVERQFALTVATCQWRINRASAIEEGLFTLGNIDGIAEDLHLDHPEIHNSLSNTRVFCQSQRTFDNLTLYTNRLTAQSDKAMKQLQQLQAARQAKEQQALAEAALIQRLHNMDGLPFDPRENGFVYTAAQVQTYIHREDHLNRAAKLVTYDFDLKKAPAWLKKSAA